MNSIVTMPSSPRRIEPGLARWRPGYERYRVPGSSAIAVMLNGGDRLAITDPEGGQVAEVITFDSEGRDDLGILGARASVAADGIRRLLGAADGSGDGLRASLARSGIQIDNAQALQLFGADGRPGESAGFEAECAALCIIAAPGEPMRVDAQNPPTELIAEISRARTPEPGESPALPEPLADPRLDTRVVKQTAQAFEVRAGEFIQIIDVAGRQCSDFQAFDRRRLDAGVERGLDPTTTRTLLCAAYPGPGLHSKYYDQDMQALVEVVRDTVGRHDTFGLACSSRYYEDQGYFGHPNCTDNFNRVLVPYEIAERRGWPAINLFFNTSIDASNGLCCDESWSRPGDYVLLRALTDIVCASSACPDDTAVANGWNPTDIHVRVYPEKCTFSKAIAFRMKPDAEPRLTQETAFHPRTSALTRHFAEYRGYWLPTSFTDTGAANEYYACREKAAVMDLSALRKFEVLGPDAEALMQWTLTRNVSRLSVGQVVYSAMCYEHGGMLDDGTAYRLGADNFRWIGGDEYGGEWLREQAKQRGFDKVLVKSSTDQLHNIAVQGPNSRDILKQFIWTPPTQPSIDELQWFRFTIGRIGDFNGVPVMLSRTGYTGELGYELYCHPRDGTAVWDALWAAGESQGLSPLGLDALDVLRIEAGLIFAGYEFSDEVDPFEAGIGFSVALRTKSDDFVGKQALIERKAHPQRRLVGLELKGNEIAVHGDCVHVGRAQIGVVTSGTKSPVLNKNIAMARLDIGATEVGAEVEVGKIDGHQKRIPATVVRLPFYDPDKERVRA
ncbi:MAG: aminomethyltransferase family protein [Gammaproteobacteria bacterium]|nr:aminomethyltransferase family protein [Gammaproteobacteria bacterium]